MDKPLPRSLYRLHERRFADFRYAYAVISRRSGGVSIGLNLNPDKVCNFDCIYCQVDRTTPSITRRVELTRLADELDQLVTAVGDGSIYREAPFDQLPADCRVIRDIAFSGDGEPTTFPQFDQAVELAAEARRRHGLDSTKLVLITDACYLTRSAVRRGLEIMDASNGEIWAKLDAGTEGYYREVNRPSHSLSHVLENILDAGRVRPIVIQSLFMRVHGKPTPAAEVDAYSDRLNELLRGGARLKLVQLYTIARRVTESYATPLFDAELDELAEHVRSRLPETPIAVYYGVSS